MKRGPRSETRVSSEAPVRFINAACVTTRTRKNSDCTSSEKMLEKTRVQRSGPPPPPLGRSSGMSPSKRATPALVLRAATPTSAASGLPAQLSRATTSTSAVTVLFPASRTRTCTGRGSSADRSGSSSMLAAGCTSICIATGGPPCTTRSGAPTSTSGSTAKALPSVPLGAPAAPVTFGNRNETDATPVCICQRPLKHASPDTTATSYTLHSHSHAYGSSSTGAGVVVNGSTVVMFGMSPPSPPPGPSPPPAPGGGVVVVVNAVVPLPSSGVVSGAAGARGRVRATHSVRFAYGHTSATSLG